MTKIPPPQIPVVWASLFLSHKSPNWHVGSALQCWHPSYFSLVAPPPLEFCPHMHGPTQLSNMSTFKPPGQREKGRESVSCLFTIWSRTWATPPHFVHTPLARTLLQPHITSKRLGNSALSWVAMCFTKFRCYIMRGKGKMDLWVN